MQALIGLAWFMRQTMGLTPSSAEIADEFPNFFLGIIQQIGVFFP